MNGLKEYTITYRGKNMGLIFAKTPSMAKSLADIQFGQSIKDCQNDYNANDFVATETGSAVHTK